MLSPSLARHATSPSAGPLRLAIIGSGPSGFYSAARVLSALKDHPQRNDVCVHMYERLPVPNGLVRWGVAPDHLEVKNVENRFAEVARDPRFRFFGNVLVTAGDQASSSSSASSGYQYPHALHLPLRDLAQHYTHLLLSYGCSQSRLLGIPGSHPGELRNVHSALDFVNWYNGHPAAHDEEILAKEPWRQVELGEDARQMSVIGAGNVALDVARIVLRASSPSTAAARDELASSDVPESVLEHLSASRIAQVDINARRGPAQAAFTNKELREMMALPGVGFQGVDAELISRAEADVAQQEEEQRQKAKQEAQSNSPEAAEEAAQIAGQLRVKKRLLSLLAKGSKTKAKEADKTWGLNFFRAPKAFVGAAGSSPARLERIHWTATSLPGGQGATAAASVTANTSGPQAPVWGNEPTATPSSQHQSGESAASTAASGSTLGGAPAITVPNSTFETKADIVVSSVGYRGAPLDSSACSSSSSSSSSSPGPLGIPWDASRGVIPNASGRVTLGHGGALLPNVYVSGWLARGPVGVIASTMHDAYAVADAILEDYTTSQSHQGTSVSGLADKALVQAPRKERVPDALRDAAARGAKQVVEWAAWQRLDEEERRRGKELGKVREKVVSVREMLRIMDG